MGASKELHMTIQATMDEQTYCDIPDHLKDQMKIKSIEAENFKEDYKRCPTWKELNKQVIDAVKARAKRQDEIRVEVRNDNS